VVPKLNWSAPRDASWLLPGNTLQCRTSGEVILLLKSSDFIAHDLTHVFEGCSDDSPTSIEYTLCLRKWEELQPSTEFRCFVRSHTLIAISQRECTSHYPHLPSQRDQIRQEVDQFFQTHIRDHFPSPSYAFDVWRASEGDIRLVDFNPFCPRTDSLLFSWEELASGVIAGNGGAPVISPVMRLVGDTASIQPHSLRDCQFPQDLLDLASGEDIHKLVDLLTLKNQNEDDSDSS
jgi:hypothetical protein